MGKGEVERRKRRQYNLTIMKGNVYPINTPKWKNNFPFGGNHMPLNCYLGQTS